MPKPKSGPMAEPLGDQTVQLPIAELLEQLSASLRAQAALLRSCQRICRQPPPGSELAASELAAALGAVCTAGIDDSPSRIPSGPNGCASTEPRGNRDSIMEATRSQTLDIKPVWKLEDTEAPINDTAHCRVPVLSSSTSGLGGLRDTVVLRTGGLIRDSSFMQRFILPPTAKPRLFWDILSVAALSYDLLSIPLTAFDFDDLSFAWHMRIFTAILWTVDVMMSFLVGYHDAGHIEMRPRMVARAYMRGWFVPDALVSFVDWLFIAFEQFGNGMARTLRASKALRFTRVIRLLRMIRLVKLGSLSERLMNHVMAEELTASMTVFRWLMGVAVLCHIIACTWYSIGQLSMDEPAFARSWVRELEAEHPQASQFFRYLVSYHWAFAQFTGAQSPYHPMNVAEESFVFCLLFFGLVIFSSFVGSVTAAITGFRARAREKQVQKIVLQKYAYQNNVSLELWNRMIHFLARKREKARVLEKDVEVLPFLSPTLQAELRTEVFSPVLRRHKLMDVLRHRHPTFLDGICQGPVAQAQVLAQDRHFATGERVTAMLFLVSGSCRYTPEGLLSPTDSKAQRHRKVVPGEWLCEAALWIDFSHEGHFIGLEPSALFELRVEGFQALAEKHPATKFDLKQYARQFAEAMSNYWEEMGDSPNLDLFCGPDDARGLVKACFGTRDSDASSFENERRTS